MYRGFDLGQKADFLLCICVLLVLICDLIIDRVLLLVFFTLLTPIEITFYESLINDCQFILWFMIILTLLFLLHELFLQAFFHLFFHDFLSFLTCLKFLYFSNEYEFHWIVSNSK